MSSIVEVSRVPFVKPSVCESHIEKMGVISEQWDLGEVDLNGIDLKHPTSGLIAQILKSNKNRENWIYDFRTPEGNIDIVNISPETPNLNDLLKNFSRKHTHSAPEVRLILEGEGVFTIWNDNTSYEIPVQKGSFLVIPADCVHAFQLTDTHRILALRVFKDTDGWIPKYSDL